MDGRARPRHARDGGCPGTVHSCRRIDDCAAASATRVECRTTAVTAAGTNTPVVLPTPYHILFDNESEGRDVHQSHILGRVEYDELMRLKYQLSRGGKWSTRTMEEVYNSFLRKEPLPDQPRKERGAAGKHDSDRRCDGRHEQGRTAGQLDLLFTASQIVTSAASLVESDGLYKEDTMHP
ncbi:hypothetical protein ACHAW5_003711 [Stephanodiscus triporus]|uniref:Uncharacterized protein n=1 Tax=Stephanodiscus triporus TaxID=2934178 RepID=A0ABD3QI08_9STRA